MRWPNMAVASRLRDWNLRIKQLSSEGNWEDVFSHFKELRKGGVELTDPSLISTFLKACPTLSLRHGESVHACFLRQGLDSFTSIGNSTLDFYMKCGALDSALGVFNGMSCRDSVSWNIMLRGYFQEGASGQGLWWFREARVAGFEPNTSTLVLVIQACRNLGNTQEGLGMHAFIIRTGFGSILSVQNSLLAMHADCGVEHARKLFDEMCERDVITWSAMIGVYVQNEEAQLALLLFKDMVSEAMIKPDGMTTASVLSACSALGDISVGRLIHGFVACRGFDFDLFVNNSLIDMYSKCADTDSAFKAFDEMPLRNNVSWNSILSGFIYNGKHSEALALFDLMIEAGIQVDGVTLVNLLQTGKYFADPFQCKLLHGMILRRGYEWNGLVINSLLDTYAKCNLVELAWKLFCCMNNRDMVSWSTLVAGFTHCGKPDEAIAIFRNMSGESEEKPNKIMILNLLAACSVSAELIRSKWAHGIAIKRGWAADVAVGTAILDMYSKCGEVEASRKAFDEIPQKNVVSWSAMIAAYGMNGIPDDALSLFSKMKLQHSMKPNAVTALSVLSACSHGGLVEEGLHLFAQLVQDNNIEPNLEHYACMVDMLGRAGKVDQAMDLIRSMPQGLEPGPSLWGSLLSACRSHGDKELGAGAFSHVLELEPLSSSGYVLASNMYAADGLWANAVRIRLLAREKGARSVVGYSSVRVDNKPCQFIAGDESHPLASKVRAVVKQLHTCTRMEEGSDAVFAGI